MILLLGIYLLCSCINYWIMSNSTFFQELEMYLENNLPHVNTNIFSKCWFYTSFVIAPLATIFLVGYFYFHKKERRVIKRFAENFAKHYAEMYKDNFKSPLDLSQIELMLFYLIYTPPTPETIDIHMSMLEKDLEQYILIPSGSDDREKAHFIVNRIKQLDDDAFMDRYRTGELKLR